MITIIDVRDAIARISEEVQRASQDLCARDGQLGDGDLGITLEKAFNRLAEIAPTLPDDLGRAFSSAAGAVTKVSSSSFGTLIATGLMAAAKQTIGNTELPPQAISQLLRSACQKMSERGSAALGDKTVLDTAASAGPRRELHSPPLVYALVSIEQP